MPRKWTQEEREAASVRMKAAYAKKKKAGGASSNGAGIALLYARAMAGDVFRDIQDGTVTLRTLSKRDALALVLYVNERDGS